MKYRNRVLGLLSLLLALTTLDRICISVAGPRMQDALHIGWGCCAIGVAGLLIAASSIAGVMLTHSSTAALLLLTSAIAGITFQQPIAFAVRLDIGGPFAGAMVGIFNTAAGAAGFAGAIAFGYIVKFSGGYTMPFVPMAAFLLLGVWLWLKINPTRQIVPIEQKALAVGC